MAYKIKIDDRVYTIKDGFTIKEELNETLDSGVVQFEVSGNEFDKVPFDDVLIYDDDENTPKMREKRMLIDNYDDEIYKFGSDYSNDKHRYTMTLFSQTKELERITLPNRTTTQPILEGLERKTVWWYIYQFCDEYMPKIRVYDPDQDAIVWKTKYKLDPALQTKFNSIECPEFQWNNPTLREVLNDLMSTLDCICVVKNNVLSYYELTNIVGNEIAVGSGSDISLMKKTMNSNDYVSELSIYMQNAIGRNITTVMPYQTLRTVDQSGRITTENCAITTQSPIYSVKKLTLWFFEYGTGKVHKLLETDRVLEYEEWLLLSSSTASTGSGDPLYTDANGFTSRKHKVAFLYYKRGSNSIENLGKSWTFSTGSNNFATLVLRQTAILKGTAQDGTNWYGTGNTTIDPRYILYELEYETMSQHAMNVGKYLASKHPENRIFDSQENSYIDVEHQSIFEYAKVNRLGNKIIEIYIEASKYEDDLPELGDYIEDGNNILFSRELTYYDDKIYFKGYLTSNYILRDYFTSVRAKKRSWQIASESDALTSHNILKYYVETSFSHKEEIIDNISATIQQSLTRGGLIHDLVNIKSVTGELPALQNATVSQLMIKTSSVGFDSTPVTLDCDKAIQGYSLCYNFGFTDNFKSSDYSDGSTVSFYEYADEKGEYTTVSLYLSYTVFNDTNLPTPAEEGGTGTLTTAQKNTIFANCREKPKVTLPTTQNEATVLGATRYYFFIHKDNREIQKYSMQFEYCSDNENIVITPKYIEYVRQYNADQNKSYKIYVSQNEKYAITTKVPLGSDWSYYFTNTKIKFTKENGYSMKLQIENANVVTGIKAIGIADQNGNLLIGINKRNDADFTFNTIYFNLLKSRDDNVYFDVLDRKEIGDLTDSLSTIRYNYQRYANSSSRRNISRVRVLNNRSVNTEDLIDIDE